MEQNQQTPDYSHYNIEEEREQLQKAAAQLGLRVPDSFLNQIAEGDIIEIYSKPPTNNQLYANQEFRRLCSYTDEQMKTTPFPTLFWREPEFNETLFARAAEVVEGAGEAVPWNLPMHDLVESLHPRKRTFKMQMGWIAPCYKVDSPSEVAGWVSTLKVTFIFEWAEDVI